MDAASIPAVISSCVITIMTLYIMSRLPFLRYGIGCRCVQGCQSILGIPKYLDPYCFVRFQMVSRSDRSTNAYGLGSSPAGRCRLGKRNRIRRNLGI